MAVGRGYEFLMNGLPFLHLRVGWMPCSSVPPESEGWKERGESFYEILVRVMRVCPNKVEAV
jgi:hypothetical protein